ncbi:protein SMALL AUXIN UP-REGULATED RNA 12-like [Rutidosis leptorrhynchoides]|uniref:protein SMALL AUXIN UP-REGULATED RNA 12-like n=1 Tax=Rutidosis leptorrhynchoides TaxID=125765 RepID=UPI003A997CD9
MEDNSGAKFSGIWQVVKLKELLNKWQNVTPGPKLITPRSGEVPGGIPPATNRRIADIKSSCDSDEDSSCHSPEPPPDVPKGYLAVYVGPELRRFIIPTTYLGHSVFKVLLEKTEEEYGFEQGGALTIPCEIETFKYLLKCIENQPKDQPLESEGKISVLSCVASNVL